MNQAILSRTNLGLWGALIVVTFGGYMLIPSGSWLPVHWGPSGEADAFWPRDLALLIPPATGLATTLGFWGLGRFVPHAQLEASRHAWRTVVPALSGLFLTIQFGILLVGLGYPDPMVRMISVTVGVMLILLGNILPMMRPNSLAGIRLPWHVDAILWQRTQRLGGILFVAGGLILLACAAFLGEPVHLFAALVAALLVPVVSVTIYSYRMAKRR